MKRRSNKSHKVPNVKLRPAQPGSSRKVIDDGDNDGPWSNEHVGSDDTMVIDTCPRPFKGFVFCATGIQDKPALFKKALELGAVAVAGFTNRVTHLIAASHGGPKYQCALDRKIPILKPSWVDQCYEIWLRGDDVDPEESMIEHALPTFSSVVLCPSGITELTRRTEIHRLLVQHGGTYVKNIERPVKVTHLLCAGDEETEKMRYARKFNDRGESDIKLVWEEWFWDCLDFGGQFNEDEYSVSKPRPPARKLTQSTTPSPPPPSAEPATSPPPSELDQTEGEEEEEELASVQRVPAVTLQLWQGLLKHRGYGITAGKLCPSPTKSERPSRPAGPETEDPAAGIITKQPSVISSFRKANSFAVEGAQPQPNRLSSILFNKQDQPQASTSKLAHGASFDPLPNASGIFQGLRFRILGEARSSAVREAIIGDGGLLEDDPDAEVDFIIVRLVSGSKLYREEGDETERDKYRTECWLERCIFEEQVCNVQDNICFKPISVEMPIPGAADLNVSLSGLDQSELCWMKRLLRALGIQLAPNFSRQSTHLFCPSAKGEKFIKACEWYTPVVGWSWFEEMIKTGEIPPLEGHAFGLEKDPSTPKKVDLKGKGKAVEGSVTQDETFDELPSRAGATEAGADEDKGLIQDITNNKPDEPNSSLPPPFFRQTSSDKEDPSTQKDRPPDSSKKAYSFSSFGRPHGPLAESTQRPALSSSRSAPSTQLPPSTPPAPSPVSLPSQKIVPSSTTPSPMRSPPSLPPDERAHFMNKLTTLLGKRPSEDAEAVAELARPRPPVKRTKVQMPPSEMEIFGATSANASSSDDGMRILYEDPEQAAERRKLMGMFGLKTTERPMPKQRRKSTRLAGF